MFGATSGRDPRTGCNSRWRKEGFLEVDHDAVPLAAECKRAEVAGERILAITR